MESLVVFYSRTGHTKKIAEEIAKNLNADVEEIIDKRNREGVIGFLISGYQAFLRKQLILKLRKTLLSMI